MRAVWSIGAALIAVASCYSTPVEDSCTVQCGAEGACPPGYGCGDDSFCHPEGLAAPRVCAGDAGPIACEDAEDCGGGDAVCRCGACAVPEPSCPITFVRYLNGECAAGPTRLVAGYQHTCLERSDGGVWCWGSNVSGQLGNSTIQIGEDGYSALPVQVLDPDGEPLRGVREVGTGYTHSCALVGEQGEVVCWGDNAFGQLGTGETGGIVRAPVPVVTEAGLPLEGVTRLDVHGFHACGLDIASGAVSCWGGNQYGQLGTDSWTGADDVRPAAVAADVPAEVRAIATGGAHSCAIAGARVHCWGRNNLGQLGWSPEMDGASQPTPVQVVLEDGGAALDRASLIANGNHFSCAARSNPHTLECWGQNLHHALADDTCPECVDGFTAWTARATIFDSRSLTIGPISLGNDFGCARLENDELW
jgi:hypothetical protein